MISINIECVLSQTTCVKVSPHRQVCSQTAQSFHSTPIKRTANKTLSQYTYQMNCKLNQDCKVITMTLLSLSFVDLKV